MSVSLCWLTDTEVKLLLGLCCSISPQKLHKRSPIKQGSAHVPVWAAFGGPPPPSGSPTPLLGHTADSQTDATLEPQLLTSPRMSSPGNLEPARPYLDVEFINMGMRLKGTRKKVLAGVTGRLRASHLTAIMGPSGAGQQCQSIARLALEHFTEMFGQQVNTQHLGQTSCERCTYAGCLCTCACIPGYTSIVPRTSIHLISLTGGFQHACIVLTAGFRGPRCTALLRLECFAVGKTSLMSALAGKASYGTVTGSVTINGKADKLLRYKRVMGFVPQVSPNDCCYQCCDTLACLVLLFNSAITALLMQQLQSRS